MKLSLIIILTVSSFTVGSCIILPKTVKKPNENSKLVAESWSLEVHELGDKITVLVNVEILLEEFLNVKEVKTVLK